MRFYPDPLASPPSKPRSKSPMQRGEGHKLYEHQFSQVLDNESNRKIAADLAEVKRTASANVRNIGYSLRMASRIDPRKNGVGSRGGHIARTVGSPGPLNGFFTVRKGEFKYRHTKHLQLMDGISLSAMKIDKREIVVHDKDWDHNFVAEKSLRPATARPATAKAAATDLIFDDSISNFEINRRRFELQTKIKSKSSRDLESELSLLEHMHHKEIGKNAYRPKKMYLKSRDKTSAKLKHHLNLMEDSSTLNSFSLVDWDNTSFAAFPGSELESGSNDFNKSRPSTGIDSNKNSHNHLNGFNNNASSTPNNNTVSGVIAPASDHIDRVHHVFNSMLEELHYVGGNISVEVLDSFSATLVPPYTFLPLAGYVCVLLGYPPNPQSAMDLFTGQSEELSEFLNTVDPFTIAVQRVRKAMEVRNRFFKDWEVSRLADENEDAASILSWIIAFDAIADLLIAVHRLKQEHPEFTIQHEHQQQSQTHQPDQHQPHEASHYHHIEGISSARREDSRDKKSTNEDSIHKLFLGDSHVRGLGGSSSSTGGVSGGGFLSARSLGGHSSLSHLSVGSLKTGISNDNSTAIKSINTFNTNNLKHAIFLLPYPHTTLELRQFCTILCADQTCLNFWRRVYARPLPKSTPVPSPVIHSSTLDMPGNGVESILLESCGPKDLGKRDPLVKLLHPEVQHLQLLQQTLHLPNNGSTANNNNNNNNATTSASSLLIGEKRGVGVDELLQDMPPTPLKQDGKSRKSVLVLGDANNGSNYSLSKKYSSNSSSSSIKHSLPEKKEHILAQSEKTHMFPAPQKVSGGAPNGRISLLKRANIMHR